ncbi:SpaA isopeptide-forming pilin-related protein [Nocardioides sp. Iso805N]|uniref:SpaA isopeptide-forming pilin-related protein n=1 Tax=Nocardioides sp. Iso805N TaxID=1283287 RepID=UPI0003762516|nr:SpaA isopeptide-forming pilin-related protein [Nocardioides sp. Iso805N]
MTLFVPSTPADAAAGDALAATLTQTTGTAPFDSDDAPGDDASGGNNTVRTNDTVTYDVGVRYEGEAQTKPTITFTLPKGEELVSLPAFCLSPGSSVSPATLPAPAIPVTATSWESLPTQTVTCVVADQDSSTSLNYRFVAKVRPEVPNGTQLDPVTASVVSDQVTTPAVSRSVDQVVSAAPTVDVSKNMNASSQTSGPLGMSYAVCAWDKSQTCVQLTYPITMSIPAGGKGMAPLAGPISVTDDLSPDSFYPAGTTSSAAWQSAGAGALTTYGARVIGCGRPEVLEAHAQPGSSLSASALGVNATTDNSVRNSGTVTCTQAGGPGSAATVTTTGADTTGYTVPTTTFDGSTALPTSQSLIFSYDLVVQVPVAALKDLGLDQNGTWALQTQNKLTGFTATDATGQSVADSNPNDNERDATLRLDRSGPGTLSKAFVGITGASGNTPASTFSTNPPFEGPPGSNQIRDGNTVAVKGQTVVSEMLYTRHGIPPAADDTFLNSSIMCDTWDDTTLQMPGTFAYAGSTTTDLREPSNGSPAWVAYAGDGSPLPASSVRNVDIQYGYTATPGSGTNSSCTTGTWVDSPAEVPGAQLVNGTWSGVNRVRISFTDIAPRSTDYFQLDGAIALTVVSDAATGTVLPNWASQTSAPAVEGMDAILADPNRTQSNSTYDPTTTTGQLGDRLLLGKATARLKKGVWDSSAGNYTTTAVPQYTAGSTVKYQLTPTLTADVDAGTYANVTVTDCLPNYLAYASSKRDSGAAITPTVVQAGAPPGSELACGPDETYIQWDLGPQEIGKPIDPIDYTVDVLETAPNGTYTNTALVSSPADGSPAAARTASAQIQLVVPTGIKISKAVDKPQIEVNPAGAPNPRELTWTITFANIDSPENVSNVDFVDVLPADGLLGSSFTGTLNLDSVTIASGTNVQILYTSAPSASLAVDPDNPSNATNGATTWCDAADGTGTVVSGSGNASSCPTSLADVTGLRFQRAGDFTPADTIQAKVTMTPSGNSGGDIYRNQAAGRAVGVSQPVGPTVRSVNVISSSIGDRVWLDQNANGTQDSGEPGVAGVKVHLQGADEDGNTVNLDTTTDSAGKYLFSNLPSGTYTVTFDPSTLPAGTSFTAQHVGTDDTVDSDGNVTTGVTDPIALAPSRQNLNVDQGIVEEPGSLTWTKVDADGKPLAGSVWTLTGPNGYDQTIADNSAQDSDPADGGFKVTGLGWGDYTLTEKTAPTGYQLDATPRTATIDGNDLAVDLGKVVDQPKAATLTWTKVDADGKPLAGSVWTLTGPNGYDQTIADNSAQDSDPADGGFKVTGLGWGDYTLTEKTAPTGYTATTTPYPFTLGANDLSVGLGAIANVQVPGTVTWSKVNAHGKALAGSVWTLTGPNGYDRRITDNGDVDVDTKTGAFKVTGLAWGTYHLRETKAPAGYVRDPKDHPVSITATATSVSFGAIENHPVPPSPQKADLPENRGPHPVVDTGITVIPVPSASTANGGGDRLLDEMLLAGAACLMAAAAVVRFRRRRRRG